MPLALAGLTALALSIAADLWFSAAYGYTLRLEAPLLIAIDVLCRAAIVLPALALSTVTRRRVGAPSLLARAPRTCILAAALVPVAVYRTALGGVGPLLAGVLLQAAALLAAGRLESRLCRRGPGLAMGCGVTGAAMLAAALAVVLPAPGSALLHDPPRPPRPASPANPNVILIVLDTVRADHLGTYGYPRATTPSLDRFAEHATVFEHAVAPASWTLPVHATLFTGLYPGQHGAHVVDGSDFITLAGLGRGIDETRVRPLASEARTLAELALDAGFDTGAVCGNTGFLYHGMGLAQGFRTYVDALPVRPAWRPLGIFLALSALGPDAWSLRYVRANEGRFLFASEVNALARRWVDARRDRRFFLFLNYMDAHTPRVPRRRDARLFPAAERPPPPTDPAVVRRGHRQLQPIERLAAVDRYDAQLHHLDEALGTFFSWLERRRLLDQTLVVIVGDHGESFGEHFALGHGNGVYEHELWVPLLVRTPGQRDGARVHRIVSLVDVMPTIVDGVGLARPPGLRGTSLFHEARPLPVLAQTGRFRPTYSRANDRSHRAIYRGRWKLISHSDGGIELYDIQHDAAERRNLASQEPAVTANLEGELTRLGPRLHPRFDPTVPPLDADARDRLQALGYLHPEADHDL